MQVSNADAISKEVQKYKTDVERRLKNMIASFAFAATRAIQENIPIGSQSSIDAGKNGEQPFASYRQLYQSRNAEYGFQEGDPEAGYHRGALGYSETGTFQFVPLVMDDDYEAATNLMHDVESYYQVGDTFYIGAEGPAYDLLENNSSTQTSGQGISAPSENTIFQIYKTDMKSFYDLA